MAGNAKAVHVPDGVIPLWSHGSRHQGGLALMIQETFIRQFAPIAPEDWAEVEPGRLALLHLHGPQGDLSVAVGYFPSGQLVGQERRDLRQRLHLAVAARPHALWLIMGDFNWVTKETDRFDIHSATFTGKYDSTEEGHWQSTVAAPNNLKELAQAEFTYQAEGCRSRLDRVYTNHHTTDLFEGSFWSAAWPWPSRDVAGWAVSDHRPVSFGFRRPIGQHRPPALRDRHARHPDFAKRVARDYHDNVKDTMRQGKDIEAVFHFK